jgi:16S rRNA (guanine527-N7)-methyltransferase
VIDLPDISTKQKKQIQTFIEDALEFNKTHNIFVRKSKEDVYDKDVLDCFPLVEKITPNKTVLDLGSGGGFPGILLAITKQKNQIFLLERNKKKSYFLKKTIKKLQLTNVFVINKNITKNNTFGKFDIITARAFSNIENILKVTKPNSKTSTKLLLLKGRDEKIKKEIKLLDKNKYLCEIINLKNNTTERNMVIIKMR